MTDGLDGNRATTQNDLEALKREVAQLKQTIADYSHSLKAARRRIYEASFLKSLESYKQYIQETSADARFSSLPSRGMTSKIAAYHHISTHGLKIPTIYEMWRAPSELSLSSLPEKFVLKSDGGSTSHGVLPLRRIGGDKYQLVDASGIMREDEIVHYFKDAGKSGTAYGPLFAEELLVDSTGTGPIPNDVKFYMAYGQVMQVMLRAVDHHGDIDRTRTKYVDEVGNDLGAVATHRILDPSIPVPSEITSMTDIAKHLSRASGLPFCRVDLYETTAGIVVGEITRAPGGAQTYIYDHDLAMGRQWLQAEARLLIDYQRGRPVGTLNGDHPAPEILTSSVARSVALANRPIAPCRDWCSITPPGSTFA